MKKVELWVDGACSGNPGPGGWAAIVTSEEDEIKNYEEFVGGAEDTTNNRMEMMAVIEGLKSILTPSDVTIHTDSAYIYNAFTQKWLENWQKNNWIKSDKKPVLNKDLWEAMLEAMKPHSCTWEKVKGHSGNPLNERCDELAVGYYKSYSTEV